MTILRPLSPLLAVLAVGCGTPTDPPVGDAQPLAIVLPRGWDHQPVDFSCQQGVKNTVTQKVTRHYYSFPGNAGRSSFFDLRGTWPGALGAQIHVTDGAYRLLGSAVNAKDASVGLQVTFPGDGKYFVFVAPLRDNLVRAPAGYSLTADCGYCAEFTTSDGRFYAKNFGPRQQADAEAFTRVDPMTVSAGYGPGACIEHTGKPCPDTDPPVCGTPIFAAEPKTFANICEFSDAIRSDAGYTGESKGRFTVGSCDILHCATALISPPDALSPTYYAENFASLTDANAWLATFPTAAYQIYDGPCDQPWECIDIYKPVCGVIRSAPGQTYSNSCSFLAAVRQDAGGTEGSFSKGFYTTGACACTYDDPDKVYIGRSLDVCSRIKFACDAGYAYFSDDCGCGCQKQ